ncbi:MAG: glycosyltransferase family 87 protein [Pseudomonadota bacterium]
MASRLETAAGRRLLLLAVWATLCLSAMIVGFLVSRLGLAGGPGAVAENDFAAFWAAARGAWSLGPTAVLDPAAVAEIQRFRPGSTAYFPFLHPPGLLAILLPFGALPYAAAYPLWLALSWAALAAAAVAALNPGAAGPRRLTLVLIAAGGPGLVMQFFSGQTTMLWGAILLAALALYERRRPLAAGLVLGLLAIKPPLCLLLPVAFVAARDWRFVAAAALSVLLVAALPTLWTGVGYWEAWLAALDEQGRRARANVHAIRDMLSWFSVARGLGASTGLATALQGAVALSAAAGVALVWARPDIPFAARAAVLVAALPLASPYAWYYELMLSALALAYLVRAGWGRGPLAWALFALVWVLGPFLPLLSNLVEARLILAPAATLTFAAALAFALSRPAADG